MSSCFPLAYTQCEIHGKNLFVCLILMWNHIEVNYLKLVVLLLKFCFLFTFSSVIFFLPLGKYITTVVFCRMHIKIEFEYFYLSAWGILFAERRTVARTHTHTHSNRHVYMCTVAHSNINSHLFVMEVVVLPAHSRHMSVFHTMTFYTYPTKHMKLWSQLTTSQQELQRKKTVTLIRVLFF